MPFVNESLSNVQWRDKGAHIFRKLITFRNEIRPLFMCSLCRGDLAFAVNSVFQGHIDPKDYTYSSFLSDLCPGEEQCIHVRYINFFTFSNSSLYDM